MIFKLQEVRKSRSMSQQELAVKCGLALTTIQSYESGRKKQYNHELIEKFCEVLECTPADLFVLEPVAA